jgi:hypothetical protein
MRYEVSPVPNDWIPWKLGYQHAQEEDLKEKRTIYHLRRLPLGETNLAENLI